MKRPNFILHGMAWIAGIGLAVYALMALLLSGEDLQEISTSLNLGVSVAIVFTWFPAALYAISHRAIGKNQLIIAVFTMFSVFIIVRAYNVLYVAFGRPEVWPNATIIGLFGYLIFLSGALFLAAPASIDRPDVGFFRQLKVALFLGVVTGCASYWAQIAGILN